MSLQFISDSKGKTTGVHIPIKDWNEITSKYKGIEQDLIDVPNWQIEKNRKRIEEFEKNPEQALDFDLAMDSIEREL